jgi:hypothetical protein
MEFEESGIVRTDAERPYLEPLSSAWPSLQVDLANCQAWFDSDLIPQPFTHIMIGHWFNFAGEEQE